LAGGAAQRALVDAQVISQGPELAHVSILRSRVSDHAADPAQPAEI
jgi:hypothetical protein